MPRRRAAIINSKIVVLNLSRTETQISRRAERKAAKDKALVFHPSPLVVSGRQWLMVESRRKTEARHQLRDASSRLAITICRERGPAPARVCRRGSWAQTRR